MFPQPHQRVRLWMAAQDRWIALRDESSREIQWSESLDSGVSWTGWSKLVGGKHPEILRGSPTLLRWQLGNDLFYGKLVP